MKQFKILIGVLIAFSVLVGCESEDQKRLGAIIEEAEKIILTKEEFDTLKAMEARRNTWTGIDIEESRVIDDALAENDERCSTPSFQQLFELYQTGKKRDWLKKHGFEVNYCVKMMNDRDMNYEDLYKSIFIGYGKCYYKNNSLNRRVGLRVTHAKRQQVDYETTFKESFEAIEEELKSLEGVERTNGSIHGVSYRYQGVPIIFLKNVERGIDDPTTYRIEFKSTYQESMLDYMTVDELKELKKRL